MNLTKFSRPCNHFGIIFEQEEGKHGIPLYQTWHIVNSITLYHFTSHGISDGMMVLISSCITDLRSQNQTANQEHS